MSSPPGPSTTPPCAKRPRVTGAISQIEPIGFTLLDARMSWFIPEIAEFMKPSIIPITPLNIDLAASETVDNIFVKVSVNFFDPSHANHPVSPCHSHIIESLSAVHFSIAVVFMAVHSPDRNVPIALAAVFIHAHIAAQI